MAPWWITTAGWLGGAGWPARLLAGAATLRAGPLGVALAAAGASVLGCGSGLVLGSRTRGRFERRTASSAVALADREGAQPSVPPSDSASPLSGS